MKLVLTVVIDLETGNIDTGIINQPLSQEDGAHALELLADACFSLGKNYARKHAVYTSVLAKANRSEEE